MKNIFYVLLLLLIGCVPTYQAPIILDYNQAGTIKINKGFDEVWTSLIEYSASSFFAIDNFEKDSGLMTL